MFKKLKKVISNAKFFSIFRDILAVIGAVLLFHNIFVGQVQSSCCSAVRVVNFPELVALEWTKVAMELFKKEFGEWSKSGTGKLKNSDVFKYFFQDYYDYYNDIYSDVKKSVEKGTPKDWVKVYKDKGYLAPSTLWALQPSNFDEFDRQVSDYAKYIVLRQKYLETSFQDKRFDSLPQFEKDTLVLLAKMQESQRDAVMKDIVSASASLKLAQQVKDQLYKNFDLAKIDVSTDKQAIKDSVKLQMIVAQLLSELIKVMAEDRLYRSALKVNEINKNDQEIRSLLQQKISFYEKINK